MPFLMSSSFIEKYALTLDPYPKIKADLGLTTDDFYALTKTLASEIEVARKVRQLYQRKGFKKIALLDFYHSLVLLYDHGILYQKINTNT
ncbi:MAG: hypothetical protein ACR2LN_00600 [Candidatus Levyibacteriota bacterium]